MKKLKIKSRKLGRERAWGQIDLDTYLIEIDPRIKGKHQLKIHIHELIHAAFPEMGEWEVKVASRLISEYLWKEGYRKIK